MKYLLSAIIAVMLSVGSVAANEYPTNIYNYHKIERSTLPDISRAEAKEANDYLANSNRIYVSKLDEGTYPQLYVMYFNWLECNELSDMVQLTIEKNQYFNQEEREEVSEIFEKCKAVGYELKRKASTYEKDHLVEKSKSLNKWID